MKQEDMHILDNQANVVGQHTFENCACCDEQLYFALRDNYHSFSVSISTLLECLKFAENEGVIPPIDASWWIDVINQFGLKFKV